ncbi:DUF6456 domain-containing protein [Kaistia dalseonensis]|uniref:DUF6456 domain-containing protein n=1 Tax=Kaistia dalseonensis TaxID=410840 RepID=A0ABU0HD54_9HYPH|nr:DUF6456 domain-containing protein [Kaistia dalseonensis]MCX5497614.1 DUF6456 domain-containing protein [Kaistia dalseonensis]MDQ0440256.1 hypothetical protein [Kaistia dalseonensis]
MKVDRTMTSIVRRLAGSGMAIERDPGGQYWLAAPGGRPRMEIAPLLVKALLARGAIEADQTGRLVLSPAGRSMVRRLLAGGDDHGAQHTERAHVTIEEAGERQAVTVDLGESPLGWLRARKGKDGQPMIDAAAFAAGERLRSDFTRGQLMPRVTANWSVTSASGRRGGGAGGIAELTEAALSARLRVERAIAALGPELSGTIVDFCCFLKGLEQIEQERNWPKRSAKLVLQLGLAALARHYGLSNEATGRASGRGIRHWQSAGDRPKAG